MRQTTPAKRVDKYEIHVECLEAKRIKYLKDKFKNGVWYYLKYSPLKTGISQHLLTDDKSILNT